MEKQTVSINIWKRFQTYHLEIAPSLASATHDFLYHNFPIQITLPSRPGQKNWRNEDSPITCHGYKQRSSKKIPIAYEVHQIDAKIETGKQRKIKTEALGVVNCSLFSPRETKSLDKFTYKYEALLDSAFEHWINVMRWCTGKQTLCQLSHIRQDTHWGTYLIDSQSSKRFYCPPHSFVVQLTQPVKKTEWSMAQRMLTAGKDVPIWQIYHAEAYERLSIGDVRGYIISLAISLETIIRHITRNFLKEPINEKYRSLVNTIPISRIIHEWYKLGFDSATWKNLKEERKEIIKIFELRNGIMHRGENPNISKSKRIKMGNAVKVFLAQGEKNG